MNDLVNQMQIITSSCEHEWPEKAQAAIEKARKLLDGLEVLCGSKVVSFPHKRQYKARGAKLPGGTYGE